MSYTTPELVKAQTPALATIDNTKIQADIDAADGIINIKLSAIATTPFTTVPAKVATISQLLSRGLALESSFSGNGKTGRPLLAETFIQRAYELMQFLIDNPESLLDAADIPVNSNLPIYSSTANRQPILRDFDLVTPMYPGLHAQLGGVNKNVVVSPHDYSNCNSFLSWWCEQ